MPRSGLYELLMIFLWCLNMVQLDVPPCTWAVDTEAPCPQGLEL
jgi:hypothetical protein